MKILSSFEQYSYDYCKSKEDAGTKFMEYDKEIKN